MADQASPPATPVERATVLRDLLITRATSLIPDDGTYGRLRGEFMRAATLALLPDFVRDCRDLPEFWSVIRFRSRSYDGRRELIGAAFAPLLEYLARGCPSPAVALAAFDAAGIRAAWDAALQQLASDPGGAAAAARALLETACRRVLDAAGRAHADVDSLPRLYAGAAEILGVAPSQPIGPDRRALLAGCQQLVEQLAALPADAPPPPAAHATLMINLAGTLATFLAETWKDRTSS